MAEKEWHILTRALSALPADFILYATTLNAPLPVDLAGFLAILRTFRELIRKRYGDAVQYRPEVEVGPDSGKPHVHLAMWSDGVVVTKADVVADWREAWGGYEGRMNVDHGPMGDAWTRYMLKAHARYHDPANPAECVKLFTKNTPRLPQATGGFYRGKTKAELWEEIKAGWEERRAARNAQRHQVEAESPALAPRTSPSTGRLAAARRWIARVRSEACRRRHARPAARALRARSRPGRRQQRDASPVWRHLSTRGPP